MSDRARNTLFVVALVAMSALLAVLIFTSPTETDRVQKIGSSIMCPVCQGESIASSPSEMARDMMALVSERVEQGASDSEIINELLHSYTGALLLDPPVSGPTIVLWIAPALALLAGIGVILWWRRQPETTRTGAEPASRGRKAIGALALITALAATVVLVGFFLQDRDDQPIGILGGNPNLEDVSNETMEAVIASNIEDPRIDGMRLALGERYFREGNYSGAFKHFFDVASSDLASSEQVAEALLALGWMAWDGNREADAAVGLFDQVLAIDSITPSYLITASYLKSQVLWCGTGETGAATDLLSSLQTRSDLPAETRLIVEQDLAAIANGEDCE